MSIDPKQKVVVVYAFAGTALSFLQLYTYPAESDAAHSQYRKLMKTETAAFISTVEYFSRVVFTGVITVERTEK